MDKEHIQQEYARLEQSRGFFVQGDWVVLEISGKDRAKFLHNLLSQHVEEQAIGERRWSTLLNSKGRLIGFFQVWKLETRFLLLVHKAQKEEVFKILETYWITEDLQFKWLEDSQIISTFVTTQKKLTEGYPYQTNKIVEENILRCAVDDYFIPCVQMIVTSEQKKNVEASAFEISHDLFEAIRIQSAFPLPMKDYEDPIPIEIPFMHRAISFTKGCYVGQETIARLHARGLNVSRKLLPFQTSMDSNLQEQQTVLQNQTEVGKITSISNSITTSYKVGLAWIHRNAFGQKVHVGDVQLEVTYE